MVASVVGGCRNTKEVLVDQSQVEHVVRVKQLLRPETPRGALRWRTLTALCFTTLSVLMFVWAITASEWLQWIVMVLALFWWNLLLVRAGKERTLGTPGEGLSSEMSAGVVLCGAALLALSAIL